MRKIEVDLVNLDRVSLTPNQYILAYLIETKQKEAFKSLRSLYEKDLYFKEDLVKLREKGYLKKSERFVFDEAQIEGLFTEGDVKELDNWDTFVEQFRELFPKSVTSGGYYVRSSFRDCSTKLKDFTKKYKEYEPETIIKATENYVERCRMQNYKYMKLATYFISKDRQSMLASECEAVLSGSSSSGSVLSGGL
jgi:hypothetical protein